MTITVSNSLNTDFKSAQSYQSVPKNTEENKSISNTAKASIGIGLTALAALGVYIATRGKSSPKVSEKVKNVMTEHKKRLNGTFEINKPKITKLKNGKTKIEYTHDSKYGHKCSSVLFFDKDDNLTKMLYISMPKEGTYGSTEISIYKNLDDSSLTKTIRKYKISKNHDAIKITNFDDKGTSRMQYIDTIKSDSLIRVSKFSEYDSFGKKVRGEGSEMLIALDVTGKPKLVDYQKFTPEGKLVSEEVYKPGKEKFVVGSKLTDFPKEFPLDQITKLGKQTFWRKLGV